MILNKILEDLLLIAAEEAGVDISSSIPVHKHKDKKKVKNNPDVKRFKKVFCAIARVELGATHQMAASFAKLSRESSHRYCNEIVISNDPLYKKVKKRLMVRLNM